MLYAIGDNTFGELGVDGVLASDNKLLKVSEFDDAIYKIATGARHSLILLKNGELYAFGDNSDGQCTGYTTRYPSPTKINFDNREKIIDVYCGYNSCLIILGININNLANGELYSWGDASCGKLGYDEGGLSVSSPKLIQQLKGKYVDMVSLGFQITVISTSTFENSIIGQYKNKI